MNPRSVSRASGGRKSPTEEFRNFVLTFPHSTSGTPKRGLGFLGIVSNTAYSLLRDDRVPAATAGGVLIPGKLVRAHGRWLCCLGLWFLVLAVLVPETRAQETVAHGRSPKRAKCEGSSSETRRDIAGATLGAALQARVPGINVVGAGGAASSAGTISIRGSRSIFSGQPLIYVDGIRVTGVTESGFRGMHSIPLFEFVDPYDIDRVEVLRGGAATIRYGMDAADGVIQIFTRRGKRPTEDDSSKAVPASKCGGPSGSTTLP